MTREDETLLKAIIDTNVMISALYSKRGMAFELLQKLYNDEFKIVISVPMVFEYESLLIKKHVPDRHTTEEIEGFVDSICSIAEHQNIYYLWRPFLNDAYDDHVLELALASGCNYIVTYNVKDFKTAESLGIKAVTPYDFIQILEGT